ncbi:MAG: DUF2934 domain-containing protein, partial [Myxococcales bacterium]|nr:DUF2934 domain-containing protein [Myxococcales bacterium]
TAKAANGKAASSKAAAPKSAREKVTDAVKAVVSGGRKAKPKATPKATASAVAKRSSVVESDTASVRRATSPKKAAAPKKAQGPGTDRMLSAEEYRARVAEAAYFRAEGRGFEPGHELEDWVQAEQDISSQLQA